MPCVVAADNDRDSMPVVVKEAMAMELPVVATNEVGLPELVDASCGRLVPPHDPAALARALDELLELPVEKRAALGRAGRARVVERCDVETETGKLVQLVLDARGPR
jgi:colanic acid/amylovoran biosynthesis glycosyltransferase